MLAVDGLPGFPATLDGESSPDTVGEVAEITTYWHTCRGTGHRGCGGSSGGSKPLRTPPPSRYPASGSSNWTCRPTPPAGATKPSPPKPPPSRPTRTRTRSPMFHHQRPAASPANRRRQRACPGGRQGPGPRPSESDLVPAATDHVLRCTLREFYPADLATFDDPTSRDVLAVLNIAPTPRRGVHCPARRSLQRCAALVVNVAPPPGPQIDASLHAPQLPALPAVKPRSGTRARPSSAGVIRDSWSQRMPNFLRNKLTLEVMTIPSNLHGLS
jgi:hypothetical protein